MYPHHLATIRNAVAKLKKDPAVLAVIGAGSVAHGFAREKSDVDIIIVLTEHEHKKRLARGQLVYFERESCTYEDGYVDGKFTSLSMLRKTAKLGSDPARYAFKDAFVAFSRDRRVAGILKRIAQFPRDARSNRIRRFLAQLEAWKWYYYEGLKINNRYLQMVGITKIILFGCRLILVRNSALYPYHKWMLEEVYRQKKKPEGIRKLVEELLQHGKPENMEAFYKAIVQFVSWKEKGFIWPAYFLQDSELNWLKGHTPIDDL